MTQAGVLGNPGPDLTGSHFMIDGMRGDRLTSRTGSHPGPLSQTRGVIMLPTARSVIWVGVLAIACCGLMLLSTAQAAQKTAVKRSTYIDANYGFSLNVPTFSKAPNQAVIPVMFTGPAEAGFSSNVNVYIQPIATTRKDYRELSLNQFRQTGFKVNSDRDVTVSGKDAIRFDYEGQSQGRNLHWLALAVIDKDRVIVITCTATAEAFQAIAPEFNACLDSFRLK